MIRNLYAYLIHFFSSLAIFLFRSINGVVNMPADFATYLLGIIILNGMLYVIFYVVMKVSRPFLVMNSPFIRNHGRTQGKFARSFCLEKVAVKELNSQPLS